MDSRPSFVGAGGGGGGWLSVLERCDIGGGGGGGVGYRYWSGTVFGGWGDGLPDLGGGLVIAIGEARYWGRRYRYLRSTVLGGGGCYRYWRGTVLGRGLLSVLKRYGIGGGGLERHDMGGAGYNMYCIVYTTVLHL